MAEEWGVDIRQLAAKIKNFILNAVQDGEIIQTKGTVSGERFDGYLRICILLLGLRIWIPWIRFKVKKLDPDPHTGYGHSQAGLFFMYPVPPFFFKYCVIFRPSDLLCDSLRGHLIETRM